MATKRPREPLGPAPNGLSAAPSSKRSSTQIHLTGGTCQPPRVIGYRRTGAHVDVHVRFDKRTFQCHSAVLASSSPLFEKMVLSGEAFKKSVDLPTSSAAAFEALLEYFYTGECSFPDALLVPVLETAHHLKAHAVPVSYTHLTLPTTPYV